MDWEDKILLKLKRKYSLDETVKALSKKNSELLIDIGVLKDTIDSLEQEINVLKRVIKSNSSEKQIKRLNSEIKNLANTNKKQKEIISEKNSLIYELEIKLYGKKLK